MKTITTTRMAFVTKMMADKTGDSAMIGFKKWHHIDCPPVKLVWSIYLSSANKYYHFPSFAALEAWAQDYGTDCEEEIIENEERG